MRLFVALLCGVVVLTGCGTASFSNAVSVVVSTPTRVGVFDPQTGDSVDWARRTLGSAAPGAPYATQVPALATKFFFDSSPPPSLKLGVYLPSVTEDGWFSVDLPEVAAGPVRLDAPFVEWYSAAATARTPGSLPMALDIAAGPNGWVVNIRLTGPA